MCRLTLIERACDSVIILRSGGLAKVGCDLLLRLTAPNGGQDCDPRMCNWRRYRIKFILLN